MLEAISSITVSLAKLRATSPGARRLLVRRGIGSGHTQGIMAATTF